MLIDALGTTRVICAGCSRDIADAHVARGRDRGSQHCSLLHHPCGTTSGPQPERVCTAASAKFRVHQRNLSSAAISATSPRPSESLAQPEHIQNNMPVDATHAFERAPIDAPLNHAGHTDEMRADESICRWARRVGVQHACQEAQSEGYLHRLTCPSPCPSPPSPSRPWLWPPSRPVPWPWPSRPRSCPQPSSPRRTSWQGF